MEASQVQKEPDKGNSQMDSEGFTLVNYSKSTGNNKIRISSTTPQKTQVIDSMEYKSYKRRRNGCLRT